MRTLFVVSAGSLGAAVALAACGTASVGSSGASTSPGAAERSLAVEYSAGDGTPAQQWTLACGDEAQGEHPAPAAACARVLRSDDPFVPLPGDRVCTQQYGGPETARVTGTWEGDEVDLELSRTDGCAIAQWDSLVPLVPEPAAVEPVR